MPKLTVNKEKKLTIEVNGVKYERLPIKTHVITNEDEIEDVSEKYAVPHLQEGDVLFISEKCVACTQSRAIRLTDIHPRRLAVFLAKHVAKNPGGIGLAMPETMEMALRECGTLKILFAGAVSVIGKIFGKKGWFYIIAGRKAASIDGPCSYTLPPYNEYVVLGPKDPDETAVLISRRIGTKVIIVDINDLGGEILGISDTSISRSEMAAILQDNPLGQSNEQTPMGIIRKSE